MKKIIVIMMVLACISIADEYSDRMREQARIIENHALSSDNMTIKDMREINEVVKGLIKMASVHDETVSSDLTPIEEKIVEQMAEQGVSQVDEYIKQLGIREE